MKIQKTLSMAELSILIEDKTKDFVKMELNGRYRTFVSDIFIENYLVHEFLNNYILNFRTSSLLSKIAYNVSVFLFETLLETHCKAGGNGHHVAQNYAKMFEEYD